MADEIISITPERTDESTESNPVTSIDPDERAMQRSPEDAVRELKRVIAMMEIVLEDLAENYPRSMALGAIVGGKVRGIIAITASRKRLHMSPIANDRVKTLAQIIGCLPCELRTIFELELAGVPRPEPPKAEIHQMKYFSI